MAKSRAACSKSEKSRRRREQALAQAQAQSQADAKAKIDAKSKTNPKKSQSGPVSDPKHADHGQATSVPRSPLGTEPTISFPNLWPTSPGSPAPLGRPNTFTGPVAAARANIMAANAAAAGTAAARGPQPPRPNTQADPAAAAGLAPAARANTIAASAAPRGPQPARTIPEAHRTVIKKTYYWLMLAPREGFLSSRYLYDARQYLWESRPEDLEAVLGPDKAAWLRLALRGLGMGPAEGGGGGGGVPAWPRCSACGCYKDKPRKKWVMKDAKKGKGVERGRGVEEGKGVENGAGDGKDVTVGKTVVAKDKEKITKDGEKV